MNWLMWNELRLIGEEIALKNRNKCTNCWILTVKQIVAYYTAWHTGELNFRTAFCLHCTVFVAGLCVQPRPLLPHYCWPVIDRAGFFVAVHFARGGGFQLYQLFFGTSVWGPGWTVGGAQHNKSHSCYKMFDRLFALKQRLRERKVNLVIHLLGTRDSIQPVTARETAPKRFSIRYGTRKDDSKRSGTEISSRITLVRFLSRIYSRTSTGLATVLGSVWFQYRFQDGLWVRARFLDWYGFSIRSRIGIGAWSVSGTVWVRNRFLYRYGFVISSTIRSRFVIGSRSGIVSISVSGPLQVQ